jgi:hypothetical protein
MHTAFQLQNLEERGHLGEVGVDGEILTLIIRGMGTEPK